MALPEQPLAVTPFVRSYANGATRPRMARMIPAAEAGVAWFRDDNRSSRVTAELSQRKIRRLDRRDGMASIDHHWESPGKIVVSINGEVDMSNVDTLRDDLEPVIEGARFIVFDLGGLDFIDSSGLSLLVAVAGEVGGAQLRSPAPFVRRVVELTGLGEVLPTEA
jgi:anti-sigma B factor antagonist